jgi:ElaB/YqjD/DUF883 family membrane-anchored ribosome-binding protein
MANVTGSGNQAARGAAATLGERAGEAAGRAAETVREATQSVAQTAKEATTTAAERLRDAAHDLRERMPEGLTEGLSEVAAATRSGIEHGYARLREADLAALQQEVLDWVRRKPGQALLVGVGVGVLVGTLVSLGRRESAGSAIDRGREWLAEQTARS